MKTRTIPMVLAVCLCALSLPADAAAPLAQRLPAGSMVYVGWAGRSLTFDGSMIGQLLNEPVMDKIFGAIKGAAMKEIGPGAEQEMFGHAWQMGKIAWQHPIAAALIDLKKGQGNGEPDITAALLIDLGKDRGEFAKHLDAILLHMREEIPLTDVTAGTVAYKVHKPRGGPEIAIGYLGDVLFVTLGQAGPRTLIDLAPAKALATDKKFVEALQAVGEKDVQLAYYIDVEAVTERVEQLLPPADGGEGGEPSMVQQIKKFTSALGMDKVSMVAAAMRVVDRGLHTKVRIFTPAPHRGLLMPLAGAPLTDADLAGVPQDADLLAAVKLSPGAAYDELRRVIKILEPRADEEMAKEIGNIEDDFGLSLRRDILASLGDTWVLSSAPSQGGFLTGTVLSVTVKDAKKLSAAIEKIEARLLPPPSPPVPEAGADPAERPDPRRSSPRPTIEVLRDGQLEVHYLTVPSRWDPFPIAPAWAVHKNRLYVALFPQVIQAALAENGRKSVTVDAAFRKARGRLTGKPAILCYVNTPKIARQLYHWGLIGWTAAANMIAGETGVPVKPDWLPPLSSIEKYLWPQICAVSSDAKGISFESYGSLPSPVLVAGPLLSQLPIWVLTPTMQRTHGQIEETRNLHGVVDALRMHKLEHGKMPDSLKDPKLKDYGLDQEMLRDMAGGKYSYLPPQHNKGGQPDDNQRILVYLPPGPNRPMVIAAFADGRVSQMDPGSFERMLKRQLDGAAPQDAPAPRR